ncbi:DUF6055 domain-containing protein [bacterium]|nr:DUF6055 domain-containing protein [bacterium]
MPRIRTGLDRVGATVAIVILLFTPTLAAPADGSGIVGTPVDVPQQPERCGTPWALEIHAALAGTLPLTSGQRTAYERARARPTTQTFIDTEHFRVHYDTTGTDAVLGWPDTAYRDGIIAALERSWDVEVDTLGFRPPPNDEDDPAGNGGNGLYDCYVVDLATAYYGYAMPTYYPPGEPVSDAASYIVIDNDYDGFGYADPTVPMRVTVAHEFNHACQFAHDVDEDVWYMECSAVWCEDVVYDELNDFYLYIPYYLGHPYRSLEYRGTAMYGSAVWNFFLSERYGRGIVPALWHDMEGDTDSIEALSARLDALGTSLGEEFLEFAVWNWFTGARDDGAHYEEGAAWSEVATQWTVTQYPVAGGSVSAGVRPDHLGANYIVLENPNDISESIEVEYDGPAPSLVPSGAVLLTVNSAGITTLFDEFALDASGADDIEISGWDTLSALCLIVANTAPWFTADDMEYSISATQTAPYNGAFTATVINPPAVFVSWTLDTIEGLASIRVDRSTSEDGGFEPIHGGLLPAALNGSMTDESVVSGDDLRYRLVLVREAGDETTIDGGVVHVVIPGGMTLSLSHASPNPFTKTTEFEFSLPHSDPGITVRIFDIAGRLVRELASKPMAHGRHRVHWDGRDATGKNASSGVYLCSVEHEGARLTRKFTLLR